MGDCSEAIDVAGGVIYTAAVMRQNMDAPLSQRLKEVAGLFLKLGFTAFGGPAAHIAMMHGEVVKRRQWLTDEEFLDLVGATNLIPGPNSTEMAIHIGMRRAGWRGLIVGGLCFVVPAVLIVLALAWAYVSYGATPQAAWLLYGVKPVVIAIIAQALYTLGRKAITRPLSVVVAVGVVVLYVVGVNEIALLFLGGMVVMLGANYRRLLRGMSAMFLLPLRVIPPLSPFAKGGMFGSIIGSAIAVGAAVQYSLPLLFLTFLKIGSVMYGSGYVLLAFLRADFVVRYGWLTDQQLIDAIAIGQVTPGPLFTSATFIGYLLGGVPGAILATLGMFLPAFVFVAISSPWIPRLRESPWVGGLLDGVNVAALGLMAAVTLELTRASFPDVVTIVVGLVSLVLLVRFKVNSTWLIAAGAMIGLVRWLGG